MRNLYFLTTYPILIHDEFVRVQNSSRLCLASQSTPRCSFGTVLSLELLAPEIICATVANNPVAIHADHQRVTKFSVPERKKQR
jgi:hypothetical protein